MDYQVEVIGNQAHLQGILRLNSPHEYDEPFEDIREGIITTNTTFIIDISKLVYLNSSGITAFAKLIILAKAKDKELIIKGNNQTPWQKSSMSCLDKLYEKVSMSWS